MPQLARKVLVCPPLFMFCAACLSVLSSLTVLPLSVLVLCVKWHGELEPSLLVRGDIFHALFFKEQFSRRVKFEGNHSPLHIQITEALDATQAMLLSVLMFYFKSAYGSRAVPTWRTEVELPSVLKWTHDSDYWSQRLQSIHCCRHSIKHFTYTLI